MNSGQGWHSSFWLMAGKYVTTLRIPLAHVSWQLNSGSSTFNTVPHAHSEIDIFERDSIYNSAISHNINLWNADGSRYQSYGSGTLSTTYKFAEWHVFGALWAENTVTFFIDGVQSANLSLTPTKWTHNYVNIWLTSLAYGQVPDDSALPSKIQASYVRYYQKDYVSSTLIRRSTGNLMAQFSISLRARSAFRIVRPAPLIRATARRAHGLHQPLMVIRRVWLLGIHVIAPAPKLPGAFRPPLHQGHMRCGCG